MSRQVRREKGCAGGIRRVGGRERPLRVDLDALGVAAGGARQRDDALPSRSPATSFPSTYGSSGICGYSPRRIRMSAKLTPAARTSTTLPPSGSGTSSSASGPPPRAGRRPSSPYRPVQFACRFSRNAATPSCPSSELRHAANALTSRSSFRLSRVSRSSDLICRTACGLCRRAARRTLRSPPRGRRRRIRPDPTPPPCRRGYARRT